MTIQKQVIDLLETLEDINDKNMVAILALDKDYRQAADPKEKTSLALSITRACAAINDINATIAGLRGAISRTQPASPLMN